MESTKALTPVELLFPDSLFEGSLWVFLTDKDSEVSGFVKLYCLSASPNYRRLLTVCVYACV